MTGLMPSCWGASFWHGAIHAVAYAYKPSPENKARYYDYFYNIQYILPCEECKAHYKTNIGGLREALESQETLFKWSYELHNLVNQQTGVPESKWPSYEDVKKRYSGYEASCTEMPGVCGSVKKSPTQRGTMVVETVGSYTEDSIRYIVIISVLSLLLLISLYYNYKRSIKK